MRFTTHFLITILILLSTLLAGCGLPAKSGLATATPELALEPSETPLTESQPLPETETVPPTTEDIEGAPPTQTPATEAGEPTSHGSLQVVYINNGNLFLWGEETGTSQLLATGNVIEARLSDDAQLIAFIRQVDEFHSEIWAINTDGTGERRLVSVSDVESMLLDLSPDASGVAPQQVTWIPGTHILAFNTRQSFMVGFLLNDDLRTVNTDTGEAQTILSSGQGGMFTYSPDGSRIAITTPGKLFLVDADGAHRSPDLLSFTEVITSSEYRYYPEPVWTSDSSALLIAIPPHDPLAARDQLTYLWRIPADGGQAVQIGGVPATFFGGGVFFSPDRNQLIYQREVGLPEDNLRELHLAQADLSTDEVLFTAPLLLFQSWAGDSHHYFFSSGDEMQTQIGETGGTVRPILPEGGRFINLQPVGTNRFLYLRDQGANWEFGLADLSGQKQVIDQVSGFPVSFDHIQ